MVENRVDSAPEKVVYYSLVSIPLGVYRCCDELLRGRLGL